MSNDLFTQARSDLSSAVHAQIVAGDTAWAAGNYPAAVTAYQQAGSMGATAVGPEIDAVGYPSATQKYTQQAWGLNASLAAIVSATASQADALTAQTLAVKMEQLYNQAIGAGYAAANASNSSSSGLVIGVTIAAVGVLGGILYGLHAIQRGRASRAPTRRVSSGSATRRMSQAATRRA